jgi:hypothetical protein
MKLAGIAAVLCLFGSWSSGFYGMYLHLKIVEAINRAQPGEPPIEFASFSMDMRKTVWYLFPAYRRLYPSGKLTQKYWVATAASVFCFAACVAFLYQAAK